MEESGGQDEQMTVQAEVQWKEGNEIKLGAATEQNTTTTSASSLSNVAQPPPFPLLSVGTQQICGNVFSSSIPVSSRVCPRESNIPTQAPFKASGSQVRKRSRISKDGSAQGRAPPPCKMGEFLQQLNILIDALNKGQKGNTAVLRVQFSECARNISTEATILMARLVNGKELQIQYQKLEQEYKNKIENLQDERSALQQQMIEGQLLNTNRYAPAKCIIIFKAKEKGSIPIKKEQEEFRGSVKKVLGDESVQAISAIRPTRHGGYTLIFQTEDDRERAFEKFRKNERSRNISVEDSCIVSPKKKTAKMVSRAPFMDLTEADLKQDLYGNHNPKLKLVPIAQRQARVFFTRLGFVLEVSSQEAIAIQVQGGRVRFGFGREIRLEEFIPLQQCYKCCKFGHNANECKTEAESCRLCKKIGHAGKDCIYKEDRGKWKCINCISANELKKTNFPIDHTAAQLHKCAVAQQQRSLKKIQLASAGIFVTATEEDMTMKMTRPSSIRRTQGKNGAEEDGRNNKIFKKHSRSRSKNNRINSSSSSQKYESRKVKNNTQVSNQSFSSSTAS